MNTLTELFKEARIAGDLLLATKGSGPDVANLKERVRRTFGTIDELSLGLGEHGRVIAFMFVFARDFKEHFPEEHGYVSQILARTEEGSFKARTGKGGA